MKKLLKEIGVGEVFSVAGIDFFKVCEENGNTVAVAKDCICNSVFGDNNNFAESKILKRLTKEFLPKIADEIGEENIVEHEVDLLSLDGDDKWGTVKRKISIPTFDFYRKNVKVFNKYKLDKWWWLSTPETTEKHYCDEWVSCVSPLGYFSGYFSDFSDGGVRPFLIFVSYISVSCEE